MWRNSDARPPDVSIPSAEDENRLGGMWRNSDTRHSGVSIPSAERGEWDAVSKETIITAAPVTETSALPEWVDVTMGYFFQISLFCFDVCVVVSMMFFLETIGKNKRPRAGKVQMLRTSDDSKSGWLAVLSNEEYLAEWLSEHGKKMLLGGSVAMFCRLPRFVNGDYLFCHIIVNLAVMLRCMSPLMLLLRDDSVGGIHSDDRTLPPRSPKNAVEFTSYDGLHGGPEMRFAVDRSYPWPRG
jgi:hypothetical protein